ncbi:Methionyl-tRNA formyltransferase [Propionispora sp. 2/2-37]|uniref:methionyl-tRNA formyltransferase n=1 Tax=Propionispora sp. 2/2-37 TaxID=1677858 RepID=UPI0006BB7F53|nr:methionyl-tRNA formyltransferase [Propionispora sp. 2/2-37]CUH94213.1 Methionyl-tRNA formyltransferase [Propionispora sp. 2/2-37]
MSNSKRIVFMGTPEFAVPCLERLISDGYEIAAVVTQPDRPKGRGQKLTASPVKETALQHKLTVMQPERIKSPAAVAALIDLCPDIIVVVAFGQLLSPEILTIPPLGCINVHASLLPQYRGAAPIHWAVIKGEAISGVTTMYMDKGMDTGDMLLKSEIQIHPEDTTGDLHDRLKVVGADILSHSLELLAAGNAPRTPQDHHAATYAPLLTRELEHIDWTKPAKSIHDLVRGLNPWPGAFSYHNNKIIKIWKTKVLSDAITGQPGTIREITEDGIVIETGKGTLGIYELQPESKRRMKSREYVTGYSVSIGERLG